MDLRHAVHEACWAANQRSSYVGVKGAGLHGFPNSSRICLPTVDISSDYVTTGLPPLSLGH